MIHSSCMGMACRPSISKRLYSVPSNHHGWASAWSLPKNLHSELKLGPRRTSLFRDIKLRLSNKLDQQAAPLPTRSGAGSGPLGPWVCPIEAAVLPPPPQSLLPAAASSVRVSPMGMVAADEWMTQQSALVHNSNHNHRRNNRFFSRADSCTTAPLHEQHSNLVLSAPVHRHHARPRFTGTIAPFSTSAISAYAQPYFAMKNSQGDTLRIHLSKSRDFVGIRSTRCQRKYNQDRYKVLVLNPPTPSPELSSLEGIRPDQASNSKGGSSQIKSTEGTQMDADQKTLFYFAIFDGHGGSHTADYLTANLDEYIEGAEPSAVPKVIKDLRKLGGYFRTFRPHFLEPFLPSNFDELNPIRSRNGTAQRKVHIKGKGGQAKPMIFIPHPNATESDQEQELKNLRKEAAENVGEKDNTKREKAEEDEDVYDEDEDPFVIARRRHLNRTSPLPGGTTSYFGTDRSEYEALSLREQLDPIMLKPPPETTIPTTMTLEQRMCLSFLQCDAELIRDKYQDGSTASVVVVQSKGAFWETKDDLDLILAHVGDTRILLCEAPKGESIQLTTDHHPDAVVEADRIRRMAAYVSADSFGENMFLGQLANTRALGDIAMKPFGVSAEPELIRRTVKANEAAFLVLISDGITSVMSNQEVVDCVKLENNPTLAAANVLNLAEQLGAEDNCTVLVVKLPAWGTPMPDLSKELREYRWQSEAQQSRARRR